MSRTIHKVLLALLLLAMSCVAQQGTVVGAWTQGDQGATWTFRADGTGFMERARPKMTARFNWVQRGDVLHVTTAGTSVPYQIVSQSGNSLTIRNPRASQEYQLQRQ